MSFNARHFENENVSEYEKSFEEIWTHDSKEYDSESDGIQQGETKGKIFSHTNSATINRNIDVGYSDTEDITLQLDELVDIPTEGLGLLGIHEQLDRSIPNTGFPITVETTTEYKGTFAIIWYNPINRVFVISDIYHTVNDLTHKVLEAMKELEQFWKIRKIKEDGEVYKQFLNNTKKQAVIDGDVYEMEKVEKDFIELDSKKREFDKALNKIKEKTGDSNIIKLEHETAVNLSKHNIVARPKNEKKIFFFKQMPLKVGRVIYHNNTPTKLPENKRVVIDDNVYSIETTVKSGNNTIFPLVVNELRLNHKHPHRNETTEGIQESAFKTICTGGEQGISKDEIESVEDLSKRFETFKQGFRTVNLASPLNRDARVGNEFNCHDYANFYIEENYENIRREEARSLDRDYCTHCDLVEKWLRLEDSNEEEGDTDGE